MQPINRNLFKYHSRHEYLDDRYKPARTNLKFWLSHAFRTLVLILLGMLLMFLSEKINADSAITEQPLVSMQDISEGSLLIRTNHSNHFKQLPLLQTHINTKISGMIARNQMKQKFINTSDNWIEAIYVYPLPEDAAVDHMRIYIGERIIEGQIKEKSVARKIYHAAKKQGKKAALVEQERPNLFTNTIANIAPGESVIIEIEYQQTLHYDQGSFSLRIPLAITPRYIPGTVKPAQNTSTDKPTNETIALSGSGWALNTDQVDDASRITPPLHSAYARNNPVVINIELDAGFATQSVISRYHNIVQKHKNNITYISLANTSIPANRDFELVWRPQSGQTPKAAVFNQKINNQNYQMVMLIPPDNGAYNGQPLAREVTYIIDTSGSMYGISIEQAKQSLLMAVERLRLHDKFNIIQFNSITDQLFSRSKPASFENVLLAKQYIKNLRADGGTEMTPALKLALKNNHNENTVKQIIFLTDGSVGNETALFDIIHKNLHNSRLFTVGIGSAPNSYFMRKAAEFGRGSFTYISNVNEVHEKMTALFNKLESPLITDIKIQFDGTADAEIWPRRIPDLYYGEPIILAIKSGKPLRTIHLSGSRALAPWSATLNLSHTQQSEGVASFWARQKISALTDSLHDGANKEQVRIDIIDVALNHHLVSKHTSMVAVDITPSRPQQSPLNKQAIPVNLPYGQNTQKIFGRLAQTATSAQLNLLFGISLLLLGLALSILLRHPLPPHLQIKQEHSDEIK